jgi:hypothetical protein
MMDECKSWLAGLDFLRQEGWEGLVSVFCAWHWWDTAEGHIADQPKLLPEHKRQLHTALKAIERIRGGPECSKEVAVAEARQKLKSLRDLAGIANVEVRQNHKIVKADFGFAPQNHPISTLNPKSLLERFACRGREL